MDEDLLESDDEDDVVENVDTARARAIIQGKRKDITKIKYSNMFRNSFITFIEEKYQEFLHDVDDEGDGRFQYFDTDVDLERVSEEAFREYFGHISVKRDPHTKIALVPLKYQSFSHVSGYNSAIRSFFKDRKIDMDRDIDTTVKEFLAGYKRRVASLKQNGEMKLQEGKSPISFDGYRLIVNKALGATADFSLAIFAWVFIVLTWNIMARSCTTSGIMYDHIKWENDSMVIHVPVSKGDQDGAKTSPKHVYANPTCPALCPILALAVYVFTVGFRRTGAKRTLFSEEHKAESRFSDWLKSSLGGLAADLVAMGIAIIEIGTHSIRKGMNSLKNYNNTMINNCIIISLVKGIASFLCGIPGGPTAIAIYLRAGWSLGPVQSRYITEAGGGDQLCGRAAAGLNINSTEFAALPPHFDSATTQLFTIPEWEELVPGYTTFYPADFRQVITFLVASLAYHKPWLVTTLPANHPLFNCRLWTSARFHEVLCPAVLGGNFYNAQSQLRATGVPCHLVVAQAVEGLGNEVISLRQEILSLKDTIPESVKNKILENFNVQGVVPLTRNDVDTMLVEMKDAILAAIRQGGGQREQARVEAGGAGGGGDGGTVQADGFLAWVWKGRFHPVPETFRMPKVPVKKIWDLYWDGQPFQHIAPYRRLKPFDMPTEVCKNLLSKARAVVKCLLVDEDGAVEENTVMGMTTNERDAFFEKTFVIVCQGAFPELAGLEFDRRQFGERQYSTLYNKLVEAAAQRNGGVRRRVRQRVE